LQYRSLGTVVWVSDGGLLVSKFVKRFLKNESGATAIEYGLIAASIAVVIITAVQMLGTNLTATFTAVAGAL
jgi:pilus assembly protein Flp/PilA